MFFSGPLGDCDSTKMGAMNLPFGLKEIKRMGIEGCLVEGDSAVVANWDLEKSDESWIS